MAELPDVGTIKSFQSKLDAAPTRSPDVGSIEPLTEAEARKSFGTPLQRLLKIDPISVQRDPIKRGIASIGSNILDMLNPAATFEEGLKEGSPTKMGLGGLDLILGTNPYVAMFKFGTKPVRELAKKLKSMSPSEVDFHKRKIDEFIKTEKGQLEYTKGYQSTEGRKLRGADKADDQIQALEKNREVLFKEAGVDYKKRIAKENKKRLKNHPDFKDNPEALDDLIDEYEGEELFDMGDYYGPERDFPNIPLGYASPNLSLRFLKEQNFRNLDEIGYARPPKYSPEDISQQNTSNWFEEIGENKYRLYEFNPQTGRYTQTILDNPDLATWRNFLGYAKGGQVEKNTNNNQKLI